MQSPKINDLLRGDNSKAIMSYCLNEILSEDEILSVTENPQQIILDLLTFYSFVFTKKYNFSFLYMQPHHSQQTKQSNWKFYIFIVTKSADVKHICSGSSQNTKLHVWMNLYLSRTINPEEKCHNIVHLVWGGSLSKCYGHDTLHFKRFIAMDNYWCRQNFVPSIQRNVPNT